MPHMKFIWESLQTHNGMGWGVQNKRKREKSSIDHTFHLSHSKKEPYDVGLRGQTDSNSVANWGKKIHMKSFHIRSD